MKRKTDSSNPNLDYSSDSSFEEYYLCENVKDRKLNSLIDRCLVSACEDGIMSWDSDPVEIANFLKEMNEKLGMNIPIDMDDISKKLKRSDEKIKKMSKVYQNQIQKEKTCKRLRSAIKRSPRKYYSSLSTPETSPSDENPNQEDQGRGKFQTKNANSGTTIRSSTSVGENPNQEAAAIEALLEIRSVRFTRRKLTKTDVDPHQHRLALRDENPNQEDQGLGKFQTTQNSNSDTTIRSSTSVVENPNQEAAAIEALREIRSVRFTRRKLTKTDVDPHQHRLAMPRSKVDDNLLTIEEKEQLEDNNSVAAKLIDPENRTYDICLRLKKTQGSSYSYAIGKPWNEIKEKNGFLEDMELDVRCFRGEGGQLYFLLQRLLSTTS